MNNSAYHIAVPNLLLIFIPVLLVMGIFFRWSLGVKTLMNEGKGYVDSRNVAFQTALLPVTNSFFAVGLVSIPGMMTGQILSGVSPLLAARYQIKVMCMIFAACGIAATVFLRLMKNQEGVKK